MKSLEMQMAAYAAYHRDPRNKATHFVGVPCIMLALFIPLAWLRFEVAGVAVSAAMLLAAAMLVVTALLVWAGDAIAARGTASGWIAFGSLFAGGWALQLAGHAFEGRKPALADNLFQVFIAPIFLCAEIFFALGYKRALHSAVQRRASGLRRAPGAGR